MLKLLQYCNYIIIVMQIKLMLLLLLLNCCLEYHRPIITLVQQDDPQNQGAQSLYPFLPKFSEVGNSNYGIAWEVGAKA